MDEKLSNAWRSAGLDLGIEVMTPFEQTLEDGTVAVCEAFVPHFGSPRGALVISGKTARRFGKKLTKADGVWCSTAGERAGRRYVRKTFIAELEDWGWFGPPDQKPSWLR